MSIELHTRLCDMLGIEYPIVAFSHCRDVVAAACNAGGSAVLGAAPLTPEQIEIEADWIKAHTDKPFGIDLVFPRTAPETATKEQLLSQVPQEYREFVDRIKRELSLPASLPVGIHPGEGMDSLGLGIGATREWQMKQLEAALQAKPAFIAAGMGFDEAVVDACHTAGVPVVTLVGNVRRALRAASLGVDMIVAQGTEAGGDTGRIGTLALVPQVVDAVSPIPVLAAGGIADGRGLVAALALGAVGVWTGTVWLTAHENPLVDWVKKRIIEATDEDAVITRVYTGVPARVLNNEYIKRWAEPGAPATLPMPLQNLYSTMPQTASTEDPYLVSLFEKPALRDWISTMAGNAVGLVKQRRSVRRIMEDMMMQAVDIVETG